jgi:hypothetical protein
MSQIQESLKAAIAEKNKAIELEKELQLSKSELAKMNKLNAELQGSLRAAQGESTKLQDEVWVLLSAAIDSA